MICTVCQTVPSAKLLVLDREALTSGNYNVFRRMEYQSLCRLSRVSKFWKMIATQRLVDLGYIGSVWQIDCI